MDALLATGLLACERAGRRRTGALLAYRGPGPGRLYNQPWRWWRTGRRPGTATASSIAAALLATTPSHK